MKYSFCQIKLDTIHSHLTKSRMYLIFAFDLKLVLAFLIINLILSNEVHEKQFKVEHQRKIYVSMHFPWIFGYDLAIQVFCYVYILHDYLDNFILVSSTLWAYHYLYLTFGMTLWLLFVLLLITFVSHISYVCCWFVFVDDVVIISFTSNTLYEALASFISIQNLYKY